MAEELDYATEQKKVEVAFMKDLKELLVKYKADLSVDYDDHTIEVECDRTMNEAGDDWIIPWTYFTLPRNISYTD